MNRWFAVSALALVLAACGKEIGDECESAQECISTDTDRICLTQAGEGFPDGYCSQFNCAPETCPGESSCVAYRRTLGADQCADESSRSRLERTYCMLRCDTDADCRSGYRCQSADGDNPLGAEVIDRNSAAKVCSLAYAQPDESPKRESEVCQVQVYDLGRRDSGTSSVADGSASELDGALDGSATGDASP